MAHLAESYTASWYSHRIANANNAVNRSCRPPFPTKHVNRGNAGYRGRSSAGVSMLKSHERYIVEPTPLGRGGFGEVYRATDILFDREVVIKSIVASRLYGLHDASIRRQFFRESAIAARLSLNTPFVVRVFDFGYDPDTSNPFFVMEFVEGYDLSKQIGQFPAAELPRLCDHVLAALKAAHTQGVVHSDISPDNILFDQKEQRYKLNDFGLAKMLNSTLMSRGSVSLTGGKPGFLPPHDWQTGERTPFSDLYAFSITIVNLLTGSLPRWKAQRTHMHPPNVADDVMPLIDISRFPEFELSGTFEGAFKLDGESRLSRRRIGFLDLLSVIDEIWQGQILTVDGMLLGLLRRTRKVRPVERYWPDNALTSNGSRKSGRVRRRN